MKCGWVTVTDGFFSGGSGVDVIQWQGNFNQFFGGFDV
jgi:hypothetical protein